MYIFSKSAVIEDKKTNKNDSYGLNFITKRIFLFYYLSFFLLKAKKKKDILSCIFIDILIYFLK